MQEVTITRTKAGQGKSEGILMNILYLEPTTAKPLYRNFFETDVSVNDIVNAIRK